MTTNRTILNALVAVSAIALMGCASTVPKELTEARNAFARVSAGPAATLVPADVHKARTALAKAEKAFSDDSDSYKTRDLAYVALRKSEMADALASIAAERERSEQSAAEFSTLQGDIVDSTRADLTRSEAQLAKTHAALMSALGKLAEVQQEERGVVITLSGSVLFRSNESSLLLAARTRLDEVAAALTAHHGRDLIVEGHTDSRGSHDHNLDLSQRRADSVRTYLVSRGYPEDQVSATGLGQDRPIADNATAEGRSNNRRVEIIIRPSVAGWDSPSGY